MRRSGREAKVNDEKEKGKESVESVKEGAETQKGPREANAICKCPLVPAGSHQGAPGQPHRQDTETGAGSLRSML